MKNLPILLLFALLLAAPAGQLSAHHTAAKLLAGQPTNGITPRQVLNVAAPLFGTTADSLYAGYLAGTVTIAYVGPIRNGHRYAVTSGNTIIIDIILK
jgi:hypothetical protein